MTYTGAKIDINTYIKLMANMYYDTSIRFNKTDFLNTLMIHFANDHPTKAFDFGFDIF